MAAPSNEVTTIAARLREAAEAHPLRLPVNRRIDDRHRHRTRDGLLVQFTVQVSSHSLIHEALFERADGAPTDAEVGPWLEALFGVPPPDEEPGLPGAHVRRFERFDQGPIGAPLA